MNENNKKGYLFAIIGVCTLVIAIAGSTYAYFVASSTSGSVSGKTLGVGLKIPPQTGDTNSPGISLVSATGTKGNGLIPIYDGTVTGHTSQMSTAVSAAKNCVDSNNYTVCHIYKVKIMNTGSDTISVDTTVSLNKGGSANLKWASMTNANTFGSIEPAKLASGVTIAANGTSEQYLVVYLNNTGADQTTADSGKNYSFTVTATASTGQQVQATFNA